jgi:hypothetical protein
MVRLGRLDEGSSKPTGEAEGVAPPPNGSAQEDPQVPVYHSGECERYRWVCEAQRAAWIARWPHHCQSCQGRGAWKWLDVSDPCHECVENDLCARCLRPLRQQWWQAILYAFFVLGVSWPKWHRLCLREKVGPLIALMRAARWNGHPVGSGPCLHCGWDFDDGCPESLPPDYDCGCENRRPHHGASYNAVC